MEVSILSQENGMAELAVSFPGSALTAALDDAYNVYAKNHAGWDVPRGEVMTNPKAQDVVSQAIQELLSDNFAKAMEASGLTAASEPKVSVEGASEETGAVYHIRFALRPQVVLGQYKGFRVKCPAFEPTQAQIDGALAQARQSAATLQVVDRPAQLGDTTTIDFTGYLDGVPFQGGEGKDFDLTLGSGQFIPGFEDQLVGASVGDHVVVSVTFPEQYPAPNLAGKATTFRVHVKKVAQRVESPLTQEQETQVLSQLKAQCKQQADMEIEDQVLGKIIDGAQMEIPEAMVDSEVSVCMDQFVNELGAQGIDLESYQQRYGLTTEQMLQDMRPMSLRRIQLRLVLEAIAQAEGMAATEEEVEARWEAMAQQYGVDVPRLKVYAGDGAEAALRQEVVVGKAYALLRESTILEMD